MKIDRWKSKEGLALLAGWARNGLTDIEIAKNMGVSRSTLAKWKNENSDISDTLKKNREVCDCMVENALFKSALEGNITAQIFWLKNRKPEAWRDKVEKDVSVDVESGGVIEIAPVKELVEDE